MKLVLTCGHSNSGFRVANDLLVSAGLQPVAAASSASPAGAAATADVATSPVGIDAEEAALGWAEAHNAGLLDACSARNPQIGFVLVYSSPQHALAESLKGRVASVEEIDQVLGEWQSCNDDLLRFYNRHAERCVLIDLTSVMHAPERFVEHTAQVLDLPLRPAAAAGSQPARGDGHAIAACLAQGLVEGHRAVTALHLELASQATLDPAEHNVAQLERIESWQQYAHLLNTCRHQGELVGQLEARLAAAARAAAEKGSLLVESDALLVQAKESASQEARSAAQLQQQLTIVSGERDHLILQLHQMQEELEALALASQAQAGTNRAELETCVRALEEQSRLATARLAEATAAANKSSELARLAEDRQALLERTTTERDEQASRVDQLQARLAESECSVLAQTVLLAERERAPDPAQGQALVTELTQENELLLLHLHQVQEELEHHYLQHRDLAAQVEADAPLLTFFRHQWAHNQPGDVVLDLRRAVVGSNWHDAEADGRWAGPGTVSVLQFPALRPGLYSIQLAIADAMHSDILLGMEVLVNGDAVETETMLEGYPALVLGTVALRTSDRPVCELQLRFPRVMAPRERGEDDERLLAVRLQSITLTWLEPI